MDDVGLLAALRADPDEGLRILVGQYEGLLFSVVRSVLRDAPDADIEECVSDVFADFFLALDRFETGRGSIRAFLCVSAKNRALNIARSRARRKVDPIGDAAETLMSVRSAEETYFDDRKRKLLVNEVQSLGKPDSEIIFRKFYLGQTANTIAQALKISVANVHIRTHRALKKLRDRLEKNDLPNEE